MNLKYRRSFVQPTASVDSDRPLDRRSLLQRSALGLGGLGLATLLSEQGYALDAQPDNLLNTKAPHFPGKAKRVIHFFLNGGPSHVDTFDPKPALSKYAGKPVPNTLTTERKTGAAFPSPFRFHRYGESGRDQRTVPENGPTC
jgi:hypothetical protein